MTHQPRQIVHIHSAHPGAAASSGTVWQQPSGMATLAAQILVAMLIAASRSRHGQTDAPAPPESLTFPATHEALHAAHA